MQTFDCFNGDADGICALTQLRLKRPMPSKLITGVKRDINLLKQVQPSSGDVVNVLDVSMDKNKSDLLRLLDHGAEVFYCDHHFAGDIPEHEKLTSIINTTSNVCTSLLINQHLDSAFLEWAVVGTFGDNLKVSAQGLAKPLDLNKAQLDQLERLGIYLNYNGYGASLDDLYFDPAELFQHTSQHETAFAFINEDAETFATLENGYQDDMNNAAKISASEDSSHAAVFQLPEKAWARRVSGVFGNDLANKHPQRAHAVLTEKVGGGFLVSVRAPLNNKQGADQVCRQFETGGGRAAAAGINHLADADRDRFVAALQDYYSAS